MSDDIVVCEQCGKRMSAFGKSRKVRVFGKEFCFCSDSHAQIWLDNRSRHFTKETDKLEDDGNWSRLGWPK